MSFEHNDRMILYAIYDWIKKQEGDEIIVDKRRSYVQENEEN